MVPSHFTVLVPFQNSNTQITEGEEISCPMVSLNPQCTSGESDWIHRDSRANLSHAFYPFGMSSCTETPYEKEFKSRWHLKGNSGTAQFLFSATLETCLFFLWVSPSVAGVTWQGGTRLCSCSLFRRTIFSGFKEGRKITSKDRNAPSSLSTRLKHVPLFPSSLCKHFLLHLTVTWPGCYDTQQQVRAFGCSSSTGCLNLRRGGSPLAGV